MVGQPVGWKCTVSGTLGSIGTVTATTSAGSNVVTFAGANVANVAVGQKITITGSGSGPYYIRKLVGTTGYLDSNAVNAVTDSVAFSAATLVALPNL